MKTLTRLTIMLAVLSLLGLAACGEDSEETPAADNPPEETTEEAPAEETADEAPAEEAPAEETAEAEGGGGGSVCERAASCCEAYVNAMSANTPGLSAETTCAAVANIADSPAADQTCQTSINSWRTGLEAAQMDVPEACQGS